MAITHVKVTYSVQPRTVLRVQELALRWGVPKSEVIRRVVEAAENDESKSPRLTPRQALEWLVSTAKMTAAEAKKFDREIRSSRRASGRKRGRQQDKEWKKYARSRAIRIGARGAA